MALSIARRTKATLHLSMVHKPLEATYAEIQLFDDTLDRQILAQEEAYLKNISKRLLDVADVPIQLHHQNATCRASCTRRQWPPRPVWSS